MIRRLLIPFAIGLAFIACMGAAWQFNRYRKEPISQAVDPIWWYRHLRGTDLYDSQYAILFHGNPNLREVALTIDDGPHPRYGDKILSVLELYHVPATFFVVGVKVRQHPEFVRRAVADGDEIGNHTYNHYRLPPLPPHEIANELRLDDVAIYKAAHVHPTVMRPPGDEYDDKVSDVVKALGYVDVCWTDAAKDYLNQSPAFIEQRVIDRVEPGSIILLHQDYPGTAVALPSIIRNLQARGYRFVTINTMLAHLSVQPYASQLQAQQSRLAASEKRAQAAPHAGHAGQRAESATTIRPAPSSGSVPRRVLGKPAA